MMVTVPQVTSGSGLRKFQADGFLFNRVYISSTYMYDCHPLLFLSRHLRRQFNVVHVQGINPLKARWIYRFQRPSPYRAVNTLCLGYKNR